MVPSWSSVGPEPGPFPFQGRNSPSGGTVTSSRPEKRQYNRSLRQILDLHRATKKATRGMSPQFHARKNHLSTYLRVKRVAAPGRCPGRLTADRRQAPRLGVGGTGLWPGAKADFAATSLKHVPGLAGVPKPKTKSAPARSAAPAPGTGVWTRRARLEHRRKPTPDPTQMPALPPTTPACTHHCG